MSKQSPTKIKDLLTIHPLYEVFVATAVKAYAQEILKQDESPWPEHSIINWGAWKQLAEMAEVELA